MHHILCRASVHFPFSATFIICLAMHLYGTGNPPPCTFPSQRPNHEKPEPMVRRCEADSRRLCQCFPGPDRQAGMLIFVAVLVAGFATSAPSDEPHPQQYCKNPLKEQMTFAPWRLRRVRLGMRLRRHGGSPWSELPNICCRLGFLVCLAQSHSTSISR